MNTNPENELDRGGRPGDLYPHPPEGAHRAPQPENAPQPETVGADGIRPDLPAEETSLANELWTLSENTHPDEQFVARLQGELTRKRMAPRPASSPSLAERLRGLLRTTWGWALPVGAVVLFIAVVSLLLQSRPRQNGLSGQNVPAWQLQTGMAKTATATWGFGHVTNTPYPPGAHDYTVQKGDTLYKISLQFGVSVASIVEANHLESGDVLTPGMTLLIPASTFTPSLQGKIYIVQEGDTLDGIASNFSVTVEALLDANLLEPWGLPIPGMRLKLPASTTYPAPVDSMYTVLWGDTLTSIANHFHITVEALLEANNLQMQATLYTGMTLVLPYSVVYPGPNETTYTVQEGDTLSGVAKKLGVTVQTLLDANPLKIGGIPHPGMRLLIPSPGVYPAPIDSMYTVQPADTLAYLAQHFGVSVEVLLEANALTDGDTIHAGQILVIPTGSRAQITSTPDPAAQAILDELHRLVSLREAALLTGPGWIHVQLQVDDGAYCPSDKPGGEPVLCPHEEHYWMQLNAQNQVVATIFRQFAPTGQAVQEWESRDGLYRDLTRGITGTVALTTTYKTDWDFTVQAGTPGFRLSQSSVTQDGEYQGMFIVELSQMYGRKEAVFDPQTGALLELTSFAFQARKAKVLAEERVDQPPADALELFDRPLPKVTPTPVPPPTGSTYTIQEADTLAGIAAYFGVTIEDLSVANSLPPDYIPSVGATLIIPPPTLVTKQNPYTVQVGDTLAGIAANYGVTAEAILQANDLQPGDALRVGQSLIIPGMPRSNATPTPGSPPAIGTPQPYPAPGSSQPGISPTPTPTTVVLDPATQALLDELQNLVEIRRASLLNGPGWVYLHTQVHQTSPCGSPLPNGAVSTCDYEEHTWSELNANGEVTSDILRQVDPSGQVFQELVMHDGLLRNFSFGTEGAAPQPYPYPVDQDFLAEATMALKLGASLHKVYSSINAEYTGQFILRLEKGNDLREAVFDPQTGAILAYYHWSKTENGTVLSYSEKVLAEERVDQPPADALALLDPALPLFRPLPPQGTPMPSGYDLTYSTLTIKNINGDSGTDPSFEFGDIYADGLYLVGRVDFGAVPGGNCQRSPDGARISYIRTTLSSDNNGTPAQQQLRWLDLRTLSNVNVPPIDLQVVSASRWDPGSTRLAFSACDADQVCGVYVYDTTSGDLKRLADGGSAAQPPVWSPGGVEIAFQAGDDNHTVVVDAGSGMAIANPGWQPQFDYGFSTRCEAPRTAPFTTPEVPANWLTYANPDYGFTFRYPPEWYLDNRWTHCAQFWQGDLFLNFCFRRPDEPADYEKVQLPSGDLQPGGTISFFGQALARQALVYQGKTKVILYVDAGRGDMIFSLSLEDTSLNYDAVDLPADFQQQVDQIIESFAWIPTLPPEGQAGTPTPESSEAQLPSSIIVNISQDWAPIYIGPGVEYPQAGEVARFAKFDSLGRTADHAWIAFSWPGFPGETAWIAASAVVLMGKTLPEMPAPPLPAITPTPVALAYTAGDEFLAQQALSEFLGDLHTGQYAQAAALYAGDYSVLANDNPGVDPNDHAALLQNACTGNGYQCLEMEEGPMLGARYRPVAYAFKVRFLTANGEIFVRGPCCGATEAEMPSVAEFYLVVVKVAEGQFVVLSLPPYVP